MNNFAKYYGIKNSTRSMYSCYTIYQLRLIISIPNDCVTARQERQYRRGIAKCNTWLSNMAQLRARFKLNRLKMSPQISNKHSKAQPVTGKNQAKVVYINDAKKG